MTREVVTVGPETTAAEALALCRRERIRHLPVIEEGRLVGVTTDRDLRLVIPALGDPNRAEALRRVRVGDEMVRDVVTAHPEDPIEYAASEMNERKIGCLPVVDGNDLVGIVAAADVMRALVHLLGVHEPGSRVEVVLPDRVGEFAEIASITRDEGIKIVSVFVAPREDSSGTERVAVLRLNTINPKGVVESLRNAGYTVLWPPSRESMLDDTAEGAG